MDDNSLKKKAFEKNSNIAIKVENLGKCYHIYDRPQDRLKQSFLWGRKKLFRDFWALQNISFEIEKGETVGIIGRNGSGKSTLLQLICGILMPTTGEIQVNGRVAALLELGSGFNPEFTGRENVYMNAALLGLSRQEIDAKYEDIIAFADIGNFVDQPVKAYSSGMVMKLAFAVISHVDADILVIDEALAVGDIVFVQKCMRFIRSFQERGTLFFVSHDTASVQNLCRTSIWLGKGQIQKMGPSKSVVEAYLQYTLQEIYGDTAKLNSTLPNEKVSGKNIPEEVKPDSSVIEYGSKASLRDNIEGAGGWKTGVAEILSVKLEKLSSDSDAVFAGGEKVCLIIRAKAKEALDKPILGFLVKDRLGQDLFGENTLPLTNLNPRSVEEGREFMAKFFFRLPMLPNGQYSITASVANGNHYDHVQHHFMHDALIINVTSSKIRWGLVGIPFERIELEQGND